MVRNGYKLVITLVPRLFLVRQAAMSREERLMRFCPEVLLQNAC